MELSTKRSVHACDDQPGRSRLKHFAFVHALFGTDYWPIPSFLNAFYMQTRGSDRSTLLWNVGIRSYEVTWTLQLASGERGNGSSSKTHAASPFQLMTNYVGE